MNPKAYRLWLIVALAAISLAGWAGYVRNQSSAASRVVWEYRTMQGRKPLRDDQLNELGAQGWELIMYDDGQRGNGSYDGTYYFKRAR